MSVSKEKCPLCQSDYANLYEIKSVNYYKCKNCFGIYMGESFKPDIEKEKLIYLQHQNDVNDLYYQKFVSPITRSIGEDFTKDSKGLDFGAGTGPVIAKVLKDNGYDISIYDPLFHKNESLLETSYDFIASCEVIEHFHKPYKEFALLKSMLHNGSKLYCMTEVYSTSIDFSSWYYKNDPSHVFFYHIKTLQWIQKEFGFKGLKIKGRLIVFSN